MRENKFFLVGNEVISIRSPVDIIKGEIVSYDESTGEIFIRAKYSEWQTMIQRHYKFCLIQMLDGRTLSAKQRNVCYKLLRAISDYTGDGPEKTKEIMKQQFLESELSDGMIQDFSLSNVSMSVAAAFQRYLVRFIVDWDIPTEFPLLEYVDDVSDYVYACAVKRKCCVCGKPAEVHHHKRIGMGRDRTKIDHGGLLMEPLCRIHHTECHTMTQDEFDDKYLIRPITITDELKKIWNLTGKALRYDQLDLQDENLSEERMIENA